MSIYVSFLTFFYPFFLFDFLQTKAGLVLLSINPFRRLSLYGKDYVHAYRHKLIDTPHVYAVSDNAFTEMMRGNSFNTFILIINVKG